MPHQFQRPDITTRLFLLIFNIAGLAMIVVGGLKMVAIATGPSKASQSTAAVHAIIDSGQALTNDIEHAIQPAMRRGRMIATSHETVDAIKKGDPDELIEFCNRSIRNSTEVDAIAVFDKEGKLLALNSVYSEGTPVPIDRFQRIMKRDFSGREIIVGCINNELKKRSSNFKRLAI
jgi:Double sensory domain of two-component sensor kinase